MKREAQPTDHPYSHQIAKRQKYDAPPTRQSYGDEQRDPRMNAERHGQQRQQQQYSTRDGRPSHFAQNNGSNTSHSCNGNGRSNGRGHARSGAPPPSVTTQQDPVASLESLLTSLTANPDAVNQVLGPAALDHVTNLLSILSSRDKSSKSSLDLFQPPTVQQPGIHSYTTTQPLKNYSLPPLPSVPDGPYLQAVFTHKSTATHDRVSGASDLTYEKLEFLGDAYIEIIATRLIFARFPNLTAGRQAQTRERIVKNDTLAQFGSAYNFQSRIQASDINHAGPKAATKILADVFEAYVAAIILADPLDGFKAAEEWLTELWSPILLDYLAPTPAESATGEYNSNAKQELQQKLLAYGAKLEYVEERPMQQSKHSQKYFVGLYLTGYGYEKEKIGYGEGRNKVEAGNRAAMQALDVNRSIVEDAAKKLAVMKEQKRLEREEKELQQQQQQQENKESGEL